MTSKFEFIVFDLDGTLLTPDFKLLDSTLEAISHIRDLGYRISVATGRSYKSAKPFLDKLAIVEPMVFSNGSVFDNPATGIREVFKSIPLETALIILMLLPDFKVSLKVHLADGTIYKSNDTPWPDEGKHFVVGKVVPNLTAELTQEPIKMVMYGELAEMRRFSEKSLEIIGAKKTVRFFQSHNSYFEITNQLVSKGGALLKLMAGLGIEKEKVVTVGDQENDFEMLRDFGLGVRVGDATAHLKDVSSFQIPPPEEQGINKLLEILLTFDKPISG